MTLAICACTMSGRVVLWHCSSCVVDICWSVAVCWHATLYWHVTLCWFVAAVCFSATAVCCSVAVWDLRAEYDVDAAASDTLEPQRLSSGPRRAASPLMCGSTPVLPCPPTAPRLLRSWACLEVRAAASRRRATCEAYPRASSPSASSHRRGSHSHRPRTCLAHSLSVGSWFDSSDHMRAERLRITLEPDSKKDFAA